MITGVCITCEGTEIMTSNKSKEQNAFKIKTKGL